VILLQVKQTVDSSQLPLQRTKVCIVHLEEIATEIDRKRNMSTFIYISFTTH